MAEIIEFPSIGQQLTLGDNYEKEIPVDDVLKNAIGEINHNVLVMGQTENGDYYFASSSKDVGRLLILVEAFKKMLLNAI